MQISTNSLMRSIYLPCLVTVNQNLCQQWEKDETRNCYSSLNYGPKTNNAKRMKDVRHKLLLDFISSRNNDNDKKTD